VFGYSDEDGTAAADFDGKLDPAEVAARVERIAALADELVTQRAEERVGQPVEVLVESVADGEIVGRAVHQGPDVDGVTRLDVAAVAAGIRRGDLVPAVVTDTDGADLVAVPRP
jgi:tRNA A37 methylthiotransferase MiaB